MSARRPEVVERETLYEGPFRVHVDRLRLEGTEYRRAWVEHPGAVVLVPRLGGDVLFVRQYRHAVGAQVLELPAGTIEPGESPLETADRELQEECGYRAGRLTPLLTAFAAPGYSSEAYHFFLAEELVPQSLPGDEDEEITVVRLSLREAKEMARAGRLGDAKTSLGVLLVG